jgi:hypothetical protein
MNGMRHGILIVVSMSVLCACAGDTSSAVTGVAAAGAPPAADLPLLPRDAEDPAGEKLPPAECNVAKQQAWLKRGPEDIALAEGLCPNLLWLGGTQSVYQGLDGVEHTVTSPYAEAALQDGFIDTGNVARLINHKSRAEIDAILVDLFGSPTLPNDLPIIREPDVASDHWYKTFLPQALQATTRVDAYSSELYVPANNVRSISTHIVYTPDPATYNGRVAIVIQGHSDDYLDKEAIHFLSAGYAVILRGLLGFANDRYVTDGILDFQGNHDALYALESPDFNPMTLFVHPNIAAVNLALHLFPGAKVVVAGLSGGGQMALLTHALDQRIARSISVSGWKPFFLRYRGDDKYFEGDYEQNTDRFFFKHRLDYLDLVVLATRGQRKHYQVWITGDPSYFGGDQYQYYSDQLSALTNGKYVLILDETSELHQIELAHLDAYFEIDALPPRRARPTGPGLR